METPAADENDRFCGRCGTRRMPGDRFCRECGGPFAGTATGEGYSDDPVERRASVVLRLYSTFRWGDLPGMVDARTSVAVDGHILCPWTPFGFDKTVSLPPGRHRIHITKPTSILGILFGGFWTRPEIMVDLSVPGTYEARLEPRTIPPRSSYTWDVRRVSG